MIIKFNIKGTMMKNKVIFVVLIMFFLGGVYIYTIIYDVEATEIFRFENEQINLSLIVEDSTVYLIHDEAKMILLEEFNALEKQAYSPKIEKFGDFYLVTITWKTNKFGSLIEQWVYDPENMALTKIFDVNQRESYNYIISDNLIEIPQINLKEVVIIEPEYISYIKTSGTLEISSTVSYIVSDSDELITIRYIMPGAMEWISNDTLYTTYKFENNKLIPISYLMK